MTRIRDTIRRRLLPALLLGIGCVIGFTWAPAAWCSFPNTVKLVHNAGLSSREWWHVSQSQCFGGVKYTSVVMPRAMQYEERPPDTAAPSWVVLNPPEVLETYRNPHYEVIQAHGWPIPAIRFRFENTQGTSKAPAGPIIGGIELPPAKTGAWYSPRALPMIPIWSGLLVNLGTWSLVWLLLLLSLAALTRRSRRRRGACFSCGYDLTGAAHERCPECGEAMDVQPGAASC